MESKPLEGVNVFEWFTHPFISFFPSVPLGREQEQRGRKKHREHAQDIAQLPLMYTSVTPIASVFPESGIALGFQECNSAEEGLFVSPGIFMYA